MTLIEEVKARGDLPRPTEARSIREAAGVSQVRLAKELGVNRATVHRWESGARRPRGAHLLGYAHLLAELREVA